MPGSGLLGGRYRIENVIGQGGMGVVYRAVDTVFRRSVAVKTIRGPVDEASIEQFRRESEALASLSHSNIVNIYDVGEFVDKDGKRPYFVMPLLHGSSLADVLQAADSRLDPERLVAIISQACKGLQAAHNRNLIHRDLKPSNLFLLDDDSVIIIDFGIVHLAGNDSGTVLKGTLHYMAPEQLDGKASPQSDIFSLGVVCYEALTGRKPFDGKTAAEIMNAIRCHIPPPISDLNISVPYVLAKVIHRALAKQPYYRLSTAREFSDALQRALRNEPMPQFDRTRITARLSQIKKALTESDCRYAKELLDELEMEGYIDPEIATLRIQVEHLTRARTVHQLLESARARMEEEDYPLALEKVRNALAVDRENIDALALKREIEQRRGTAGIQRWYEIARQHLDNKHFAKAREAVEEVLKLNPGHGPAKELKEEIRRCEQEQTKIRQEIHNLYESALRAYGNGEISSALSKLERVIELGKRLSGNSQSDAQYVYMYDQIRQERDELQALYADGRKALEAKNFARAHEICKEVLDRRPRDALFQALKIAVEEGEHQARSAAIAEFHTKIESETDLEKKFQLAKEAVRRFPEEPTFAERLKSVKHVRDLVNGLIARARHYESQGQFTEARNQCDVLRTIYPQYPGLEYEFERLNRNQQESFEGQAHVEWVEKIERALSSASYDEGLQTLTAALAEFPDDHRLLELKGDLDATVRKRDGAQVLLQDGKELAAKGNRVAAIQCLREARELNPDGTDIRRTLATTLLDHARALVEQDWRAASRFRDEAVQLDPNHESAASVSKLIEEASRRELAPRFGAGNRALAATAGTSGKALGGELELARPHEIPHGLQRRPTAGSRLETAFTYSAPANSVSAGTPNIAPESDATPSYTVFARHRSINDSDQPAFPKTTRYALLTGIALLLIGTVWFETGHPKSTTENHSLVDSAQTAKGPSQEMPQSPHQPSSVSPAPVQDPEHRKPTPAPSPPAPAPQDSGRVVHFTTEPETSKVNVDDNDDLTCSAPCDLKISRGEHRVFVTATDGRMAAKTIRIPGDENVFVRVPDELSVVILDSNARLNVSVDGKDHGQAPVEVHLKPGEHNLVVTGNGLTYEGTFNVGKPDEPQLIIDVDKKVGVSAPAPNSSTSPQSEPPSGASDRLQFAFFGTTGLRPAEQPRFTAVQLWSGPLRPARQRNARGDSSHSIPPLG